MKWSSEARVGIAVLTAAVILIGGITLLRGVDLRSKEYALRVFYPNVNGLKTGDVVTVGGLAIGRVESMTLAGRRICVELTIQSKVHLSRDSRVTLRSETIMGGKFIEISPGEDAHILADRDSLDGIYEADLSQLTATLSPISSNVLGILENVNSTFDEPTRQRIQSTVSDLAHSSARLQEAIGVGSESAQRALADVGRCAHDLAGFAHALDSMALRQNGNVDASMTSLRGVSSILERVSSKLEIVAGDLSDALAKVHRGEGTLGKLVYEERLYNDLDSVSCNINRLAIDIRENPHRYVKVSLF